MKDAIRKAMLGVAITGMVCVGAAAQNSDQSSSSSATTKHHAKAADADDSGSKLDAMDRHFIHKAGQGGLAEVELGKLAQEKGQSEEVKKFGQRMVDDHSKANDQL